MDFASGLANLEQSAANAQNRSNDRRRGRDDNDQDDHRRHQARPRRDHNNSHGSALPPPRHNRPQDRALDGLARFGYRLPRGPYHRPPPISAGTERPLHICLLAITIDDLPYEDIWKAWATSASSKRVQVSLVCHAKHPDKVTSPWLQQRMLLQPRHIARGNSLSEPEYLTHKPAWGSVEITRAMMDLLVAGMEMGRKGDQTQKKDARFVPHRFLMTQPHLTLEELALYDVPPADKFIFISETCLPVVTLDEAVQALFFHYTTSTEAQPQNAKKEATEETPKEADTETNKKKSEKEDPNDGTEGKEEESKEDTESKDKKDATDKDAETNKSNTITSTATTLATPKLMYLDVSWVNARNFNSPNTPSNKYERDQFSGIHKFVPKRYRWKADQWMCLSRSHAAAVLDLDRNGNIIPVKDQLWNSFRRINASDEMYFPTSLALAGVLLDNNNNNNNNNPRNNNNNINSSGRDGSCNDRSSQPQPAEQVQSPWLERRRVTYTDWSEGMRNPACFTKGIRDFAKVAKLARQQGCLLARKFAPFQEIPGQDVATVKRTGEISVQEWERELVKLAEMDRNSQGTA